MWAKKNKKSQERFHSLQKKCKKKNFLMPLYQTDLDGFKIGPPPVQPIRTNGTVINFTCDLSLVCIPPR